MDRPSGRDPDPEPPHDILAADEFALGEGDPGLHREQATDVLAAEEFAMPAADHHALPPGGGDELVQTRGARARTWLRRGVPAIALAALVLRRRRRRQR